MEKETTRIRKVTDYGILCSKCGRIVWGANKKGRDYNFKKHMDKHKRRENDS